MAPESSTLDFVTLGMFIIDEIHFPPPTLPKFNILGGAGTYSALGARLFSPPPISKSVGWIVDCGSDFPSELREYIKSWETGVLVRETPERKTTRGWNGYGEGEVRAFKYMTPKLRLDHEALVGTDLLWSKSFHLICSPLRCIELIDNILRLRDEASDHRSSTRPLFIWEPVPDLCIREELDNCLAALKYVDVVSPNHGELGGFYGKDTNGTGHVDYRKIEALSDEWLISGISRAGKGGVVVRCGKDGCLVARRGFRRWMPAYHQSADSVIDPTGGGNGFLGGLAVGMVRASETPGVENLEEAAMWGSVSASLAIEQVGMPTLGHDGVREVWNGVVVEERLAEFKQRLNGYVQP